MNLVIDIGNTLSKVGIFQFDKEVDSFVAETLNFEKFNNSLVNTQLVIL